MSDSPSKRKWTGVIKYLPTLLENTKDHCPFAMKYSLLLDDYDSVPEGTDEHYDIISEINAISETIEYFNLLSSDDLVKLREKHMTLTNDRLHIFQWIPLLERIHESSEDLYFLLIQHILPHSLAKNKENPYPWSNLNGLYDKIEAYLHA